MALQDPGQFAEDSGTQPGEVDPRRPPAPIDIIIKIILWYSHPPNVEKRHTELSDLAVLELVQPCNTWVNQAFKDAT
jgi:hypothetical protein